MENERLENTKRLNKARAEQEDSDSEAEGVKPRLSKRAKKALEKLHINNDLDDVTKRQKIMELTNKR